MAAALAGDHEAASRVELTLPETGVCGGAGLFDEPAATTAGADGEEAGRRLLRTRRTAARPDRRPVGQRGSVRTHRMLKPLAGHDVEVSAVTR